MTRHNHHGQGNQEFKMKLTLSTSEIGKLFEPRANKEIISLGGPQLLSKEKHSARFDIVLLGKPSKYYMPVNKSSQQ